MYTCIVSKTTNISYLYYIAGDDLCTPAASAGDDLWSPAASAGDDLWSAGDDLCTPAASAGDDLWSPEMTSGHLSPQLEMTIALSISRYCCVMSPFTVHMMLPSTTFSG